MVPKIIHYCWFGGKKLPDLEQKCVSKWKEILPDYQITIWNEENFDLNSCDYVRQAYEHKKYAFVSDYARIKALYEYGGIYLDTDVEVVKSFNPYLGQVAFLGFENRTCVGTAVMACEKGMFFAKEMLDYYHKTPFVDINGNQNLTTNVTLLNKILEDSGMERVNKEQFVKGIHIYEREYFFPKKIDESQFAITENTISIHRMSATWLTKRQKQRGSNKLWINVCRPTLRFLQNCCIKCLGSDRTKMLEIKIRNSLK